MSSKLNRYLKFIVLLFPFFTPFQSKAQQFNIVLGRPTNNSVTASVMFDQINTFYICYGTQPSSYTDSTSIFSNTPNIPVEVDLTNLIGDTKYYYILKYKSGSAINYSSSQEYTFHTQRAVGNGFTFTIEADEHLYDKKGIQSVYELTLANQANDNPDFMLSLGDIFGDDHTPTTSTAGQLDTLHANYRPFLGELCHSVPFYVCLGNHEGENDYYLAQTPPNNIAVWGTTYRKQYYPNPYPNSFYSGNTTVEPYGIGNPENYYAWQWGDAQFIVLDVYRDQCDTSAKPQGWNWSLGAPQFTWLENTLQSSTAKYKFVFAHHIRGQGRGGITNAPLYEWGGRNTLNGPSTFAANRPGWSMPIHDLFTTYGVNVFFQGHDHLFAHEELNGITYQEVPMAADSTYEIGMLANANAYTQDTIGGTGYLRVNVNANCIQVDFVRTYLPADTLSGLHHNGEVGFSYTIGNCSTSISENATANNIVLYPNPAKNYFYLKNFVADNKNFIRVYDMMGRLVLTSYSNETNISGLSNGSYSVEINTNNQQVFKKLLINR
jgi:hypothetical protein